MQSMQPNTHMCQPERVLLCAQLTDALLALRRGDMTLDQFKSATSPDAVQRWMAATQLPGTLGTRCTCLTRCMLDYCFIGLVGRWPRDEQVTQSCAVLCMASSAGAAACSEQLGWHCEASGVPLSDAWQPPALPPQCRRELVKARFPSVAPACRHEPGGRGGPGGTFKDHHHHRLCGTSGGGAGAGAGRGRIPPA